MKGLGPIAVALLLLSTLTSGCFGGYASDWAYRMVGLREVQDDYDGRGIIIAVIDTGFDKGHSSLDHARIVAWRDFVENRPEPYDDVGHGSHVGGIIVGSGGSFGGQVQGFDLKGSAPKADLIIVKAIRQDETGRTTDVINGIGFAIQNKADVICLSLGSRPSALNLFDNDMRNAVDAATNQGIFVVASAGNVRDGQPASSDVVVPANQERVIAVGAVDEKRRVTEFSQRGSESANQGTVAGLGARPDPHKKPEIVAPGDKIRSAWINGDYAIASGTSQAAPMVCGALALLLQKCPALRASNNAQTVVNVKRSLMETAEPLDVQRTPHDNAAGYGLLRADRLIEKYGPSC